MKANEIVAKITKGDRLWLSKTITYMESQKKEHRTLADEILEQVMPLSGGSWRIGITGVPGAGKSTFIDSLGEYLLQIGKKIAVLAIDPSSQRSGGSILGDKTRMVHLAQSPNVFIRPSPAAETLGGVAQRTRETIFLLEAAGFDVIFVETVGVGQSEISVHSMVDFLLLLVLTGAGDMVQGIKRGIMEIADAVVVNKADGENKPLAEKTQKNYQQFLHIWPQLDFWQTPVLIHAKDEQTHRKKIWQAISDYMHIAQQKEYFTQKRQEQKKYWLHENIRTYMTEVFLHSPGVQQKIADLEKQVLQSQLGAHKASRLILQDILNEVKNGSIAP